MYNSHLKTKMIQLNYNYAKLRMHAEKNEQGALWRFLYWLSYYVLFLPILKLVTSLHLLSHPTKQVHVVPVGSRVSVHIIPALWTNYCYLVIDQQTKEAVAIDPVRHHPLNVYTNCIPNHITRLMQQQCCEKLRDWVCP